MAKKQLFRSKTDKKFSGLIGGLGEYLDMDTNFLRLIAIVLVVSSGVIPGLIAYVVAAAIVPIKPEEKDNAET